MTITKITPATMRANQDVISALEHCLALAKDGSLRDIVIVGQLSGGMYYENVAFENGAALLGHIARAAFAVDRGMRCGCDND